MSSEARDALTNRANPSLWLLFLLLLLVCLVELIVHGRPFYCKRHPQPRILRSYVAYALHYVQVGALYLPDTLVGNMLYGYRTRERGTFLLWLVAILLLSGLLVVLFVLSVTLRILLFPFLSNVVIVRGKEASRAKMRLARNMKGSGKNDSASARTETITIASLNASQTEFHTMNAINYLKLTSWTRSLPVLYSVLLKGVGVGLDSIPAEELSLKCADVLTFQELFHPLIAARNAHILSQHFGYDVVYQVNPPHPFGMSSGLFLASRFPLLDYSFEAFGEGLGVDALANKGCLMAVVKHEYSASHSTTESSSVCTPERVFQVAVTHLQCEMTGPTHLQSIRVMTQQARVVCDALDRFTAINFDTQVRDALKRTPVPLVSTILTGDFNANYEHPVLKTLRDWGFCVSSVDPPKPDEPMKAPPNAQTMIPYQSSVSDLKDAQARNVLRSILQPIRRSCAGKYQAPNNDIRLLQAINNDVTCQIKKTVPLQDRPAIDFSLVRNSVRNSHELRMNHKDQNQHPLLMNRISSLVFEKVTTTYIPAWGLDVGIVTDHCLNCTVCAVQSSKNMGASGE